MRGHLRHPLLPSTSTILPGVTTEVTSNRQFLDITTVPTFANRHRSFLRAFLCDVSRRVHCASIVLSKVLSFTLHVRLTTSFFGVLSASLPTVLFSIAALAIIRHIDDGISASLPTVLCVVSAYILHLRRSISITTNSVVCFCVITDISYVRRNISITIYSVVSVSAYIRHQLTTDE